MGRVQFFGLREGGNSGLPSIIPLPLWAGVSGSMAKAAKKICCYSGCGTLTNARFCSKHNIPKNKRAIDTRGNSAERGYGGDWRKVRNSYIMHNPLCEQCSRQGRVTAAQDVDHIVPFKGKDDPLRLDWNNFQSLCRRCHNKKTRADNARD